MFIKKIYELRIRAEPEKAFFLLQKSVKKGIYSYGSGYCGNSDRCA